MTNIVKQSVMQQNIDRLFNHLPYHIRDDSKTKEVIENIKFLVAKAEAEQETNERH